MTIFAANPSNHQGNTQIKLNCAVKILALFFCVIVQTAVNLNLNTPSKIVIPAQPENAKRWDPRLFKALSFGHLPAAIDWMWLQVLLDPNGSHVPRGAHPKIYYDLDLIADLDPINFDSYKAGANLLSVVRDDGPGARDLLLKAEHFRKEDLETYPKKLRDEYWTYSWSIPLLLAYVHLFELGDLPSAADAFREAARISGSPEYLQSLVKRLESPGGVYEVGLRLLNYMIRSANDEDSKEELLKKRNSLFVGQYLFDLNRSFQDFIKGEARPGRGTAQTQSGTLDQQWKRFLRESHNSETDPWGGRLSLDPNGRIVSTTPHERVFNLD